jgi:PAS domain S-box-containing protein
MDQRLQVARRSAPAFLAGGGRAGELLRGFDWRSSPLGDPATWPSPMRTLTEVMLAANQPMFIAWGPERTLLYNDSYAELLAAKHPAAMGRPFLDVWSEIRDDLIPIVDKAFAGESVHMDDIALIMHRRGYPEETHFSFSYTPIRGDGGGVDGFFCACTETTAQVMTLRRTEADAERLRQMFERAPGFICILRGPDHIVEFVNLAHRELFHSCAWVGKSMREAMPEIAGQPFHDLLDRVFTTGERYVGSGETVRYRSSPDGPEQEIIHDFIYEPMRDETGRIIGIFCEGFDVTETHIARETLRKHAQRQEFLLSLEERLRNIEDPIAVTAASSEALGVYLRAGQVGFGEIDEKTGLGIIERDWNDGSMRSNAGAHRLEKFGSAFIDDLRAGRTIAIGDVRYDARTNSAEALASFAQVSISAFLNVPLIKDDCLVAILAVHNKTPREWTPDEIALTEEVAQRNWAAVERARAEQHMRLSQEKFRTLVEAIPHLVWTSNEDGRWHYASPQWLDFTGQTIEQASGLGWLDAVHPQDRERILRAWDTAGVNGRLDMEYRLRDRDGAYRWFRTTAAPLSTKNGETQWFGTCSDFEEQIAARQVLARSREELEREVAARSEQLSEAQDALRQSQKLEAMGQLTGGVAHDFNNLLTPIIGGLDMLKRREIGGEREQRLITGALLSAERAKTLVQRLLAFARRQPLRVSAVDVGTLIGGMADLMASTSGPQVKVVVEAADGLPPAKADQNQLEMALLNLSVNARDAMPDGGVLRISVMEERIGARHRSQLKPGAYLLLSVADNGMGMDEATLSRAIEPFFSTKGVGKGTGLGLSMVHGLALQLGGAITISSKPRLGTNVELWLPIADGVVEEKDSRSDVNTAFGGRGTALVVDDEDLVRESTGAMLIDLGYSVIEARSAEDALRLLDEGLQPDLIVTDHLMPRMSGTELARAVRKALPALPVLIVSGYAEVAAVAPDMPLLTKPFHMSDLAAVLERLV